MKSRNFLKPHINSINKGSFLFILFLVSSFCAQAQNIVSISITDADAAEINGSNTGNPGVFRLSVTREPLEFRAIDVNLIVDQGSSSAGAGSDRSAIPAVVTIPAFSNFFDIVVNILDDALIEGNETLKIDLEPADVGADPSYSINPGAATQTLTIADDDIAGFTITQSGGSTVTSEPNVTDSFSVVLNAQPASNVVLNVSSSDTSEGTVSPATLTFEPGNYNVPQNVMVTGVNDAVTDGPQPYNITVGVNAGSSDDDFDAVPNQIINATNNDDDTAILTIANQSAQEGSSMQFSVILNTAVSGAFTVDVNFVDGTAQGGDAPLVAPEDYNSTSQTLNFNGTAGESRQFNVQSTNDNNLEADETFTVTLTASDPLVDDSDTAIGTILNDDVGQVTVVTDPGRITTDEDGSGGGNNGRFIVSLSQPNTTGSTVIVNYTLSGTATASGAGQDYNVSGTSGTVSFGNNADSQNINITPINDAIVEGSETVILTLDNVSTSAYVVGTPNSDTVTILDDDVFTASIVATDNAAAETVAGNNPGTFTINLNQTNTSGSGIVVNYTVSGTAQNGVDYTTIGTTSITIPNNQQSAQIAIAPINDAIQEGTETVVITLQPSAAYNLGTATATVNIADNDQATLTISNVTANENDPSGEMVFEVELDIAVQGETAVGYTISSGTATGGGVDFTATNGTLTFDGTAGEIETISVALVDDQVLEESETFTVQLALPTNGVQRANGGTATGTINDDDNCVAAPTLDTSVPNTFCGTDGDIIFASDPNVNSLNDYTSSTAPAGTALRWSRDSDPLNENSYLLPSELSTITVEGSYYGFFLDDNGTPNNFDDDCASGTIEVTLVLNPIPETPTAENQERCGPGTVLLTASSASPTASINWYGTADSDTPLASGPSFTTPVLNTSRSYWVEAEENGCFSARTEVSVTVGLQVSTGTVTNASICSVPEFGPTILDLDDRLTGEGSGIWTIDTDPSGAVSIDGSNIVDFRDLIAGQYIFTFTTTGSTAPCTEISVNVTITVSSCDTDDDNDGLLGGEEATLGTDPQNPDSDGDGIQDGEEVGPDIENPLDEDDDGIIDALESNTADADSDGVNDQQDPANDNPCVPNRENGVCDFDGDDITDSDEIANGTDPDNPCDPNAEHPNCLPIDLEVLKEVDNIRASIGDTVVFTITLNNLDPDRSATGIVIDDFLETSFSYVSSNASSGTYSEISGEWTIPIIAEMGTETLQITATVTESGNYRNTAELFTSSPVDGTPNNNVDFVQLEVDIPEGIDLAIEKSVDIRNPLLGEEITFTIKVVNESRNGDEINNIIVLDRLDLRDDADYQIVEILQPSIGSYDVNSGEWNIPSLSGGQEATLQIIVRVDKEVIFANTASLLSPSLDSNPNNNISVAEVNVNGPTLADPGFLFNQFSPNGDGTNDILKINQRDPITGSTIPIVYKIQIFDRYGNKVFETMEERTDSEIWDGTWEGKEAPKGTYFYILNYDVGNGPTLNKGWIQLIR